ncbi:MAG: sugar ABC transporter permease [Chthonomonadales bacterium]|nr:sugar ABC transporter permease [Chthonomonadales bacterium]
MRRATRKPGGDRDRNQALFVVSFLGPPVALYATFVLWPALNAFRYSLYRWDGLSEPAWVGLGNFRAIVATGSEFLPAIRNNLFLTFVPGALTLSLALFFAYTVHQRIPGARLFRIAFFFPNVISSVAVALLWILIYSTTDVGLLNGLLRLLGRTEPIAFTESGNLLWAIVPMSVWSATGFFMVLFLAAMENIPETYYEAARLDGASSAAQFRHITLPLMWDVLTTGVVFLIVGGLKFFDAIFVMENGRPSKTTHTLATLLYSKVFQEYNIGYGTAISVMLFLLVLAATLVSLRLMRRERLEY